MEEEDQKVGRWKKRDESYRLRGLKKKIKRWIKKVMLVVRRSRVFGGKSAM